MFHQIYRNLILQQNYPFMKDHQSKDYPCFSILLIFEQMIVSTLHRRLEMECIHRAIIVQQKKHGSVVESKTALGIWQKIVTFLKSPVIQTAKCVPFHPIKLTLVEVLQSCLKKVTETAVQRHFIEGRLFLVGASAKSCLIGRLKESKH